MVLIDRINPTVTLASSLVLYPLLFHLVTPRKASPSRFVQSREAISVAHCVLLTAASLLELYRQRDKWVPPTDHGTVTRATDPMRTETGLDIIDLRSPVGNAIVAWECGYLLQDFLVLIVGARQAAGDRQSRTLLAKNVNWRVLGWHHLGVGGALLLFHLRASRGEAKGVLVVLMMFLMNISCVFLCCYSSKPPHSQLLQALHSVLYTGISRSSDLRIRGPLHWLTWPTLPLTACVESISSTGSCMFMGSGSIDRPSRPWPASHGPVSWESA